MAYVITTLCDACEECIRTGVCPELCIYRDGDIYKIDVDLCTDCGSCAEVCPVDAISAG